MWKRLGVLNAFQAEIKNYHSSSLWKNQLKTIWKYVIQSVLLIISIENILQYMTVPY